MTVDGVQVEAQKAKGRRGGGDDVKLEFEDNFVMGLVFRQVL